MSRMAVTRGRAVAAIPSRIRLHEKERTEMARHIDDSKPLSDDDRQWLTDWGRTAEIARIDAMHAKDGEDADAHNEPNGLLDALKGPQSGSDASGEQEEPEDPSKSDTESPAAVAAREAEEAEDEGDWYEDEGVTVDDLKDELGKRELSKSGNKQELIDRLREADAADE